MPEPGFVDAVACLREAKSGNLQALTPLLESLHGVLRNVLRHAVPHHLRNNLLRDSDLCQDAMLLAMEKFHSFRGDTEAEFFSWITTLTMRLAKDAIRNLLAEKRDYRRTRSLQHAAATRNLTDSQTPSPSESAVRVEELRFVSQSISCLSEEDQQLIRWWMAEKNIVFIAEKLGVPLAAAYKRLARAKERLIEKLAANISA